MAELRCPHCDSVRVYRADGEYVCADCATVVDSVYAPPPPESEKALERRIRTVFDKNKKFLLGADGRYMRYARLVALLVRYGYRHYDREEEPEERKLLPSQRVINWISVLCYQLNIPKVECVKAVEVYRKYRLKLQSIYPKNAAACCIFMAGLASEEQLVQAGVSKASLQYAKRLLQKEREQSNLAPFLEYAIQLAKSAENWKKAIRQAAEMLLLKRTAGSPRSTCLSPSRDG
ncbi:MAG: hypothetical protein QXQ91_02675 [Nanopusillaceae archaeon]